MSDPNCKYDVPASHREDLLDEALDESFPASDPIALTPPLATDRVVRTPSESHGN